MSKRFVVVEFKQDLVLNILQSSKVLQPVYIHKKTCRLVFSLSIGKLVKLTELMNLHQFISKTKIVYTVAFGPFVDSQTQAGKKSP